MGETIKNHPLQDDCKRESTQLNACQNKDKHRIPTPTNSEEYINNRSTTTEPSWTCP